jgi:hypothetical protein
MFSGHVGVTQLHSRVKVISCGGRDSFGGRNLDGLAGASSGDLTRSGSLAANLSEDQTQFDPLREALVAYSRYGPCRGAFDLVLQGILCRMQVVSLSEDKASVECDRVTMLCFMAGPPAADVVGLQFAPALCDAERKNDAALPTIAADRTVGVAVLDAALDPADKELWCLPLFLTAGLLLKLNGDGSYSRVGFAMVNAVGLSLFEGDVKEEIITIV